MVIHRKPLAVLAAAALTVTLAGCGGGSTSGNKSSGSGSKGGTLYYLTKRPSEHFDPQRTYIGRDIFDMNRLVYRQLVSFPSNTTDPKKSLVPVPDLATDTGTPNKDSTQWKFTIRDDVKWQDGKPITCEDFKYGISRSFATNLDGGPRYTLDLLDVPKKPDGTSTYAGPYKKTGQAGFDKAVTCSGNTITYRFNAPFPDFPLAIAGLLAYSPFRKDQDHGEKSNYEIFSDGPYKLQGKWNVSQGGTFVRNSEWDAKTDTIRKALPDEFQFVQGLSNEVINDRLISDSGKDQSAITDRVIPPAYYSRINGPVADRATQSDSPYIFYLLPNFNQMKNLKVREALKYATDAQAQINAEGGDKAAKYVSTLAGEELVGFQKNPNFDEGANGNVTKAKQFLKDAGVPLPYPIKYTYQGGTPTSDKAAAALKAGWEKAGFKVTLDPLVDTYYDVINKPSADSDVVQGGWGSDWPTMATIFPPLFDSRTNLTPTSNNNDYGNYRSDKVNKMIDEAKQLPDVEAQAKKYVEIDDQLGKDVAYIPYERQQFYLLRGSKVTGYQQGPATSFFPDLGGIGANG